MALGDRISASPETDQHTIHAQRATGFPPLDQVIECGIYAVASRRRATPLSDPMRDVGSQHAQRAAPNRRANSFDPEVASAFGRVVRRERLDQRIAQDALALTATIDRSYFGKLERGERQPSLAVLLKIAKALGLPGSALLEEVEAELLASKAAPQEEKVPAT